MTRVLPLFTLALCCGCALILAGQALAGSTASPQLALALVSGAARPQLILQQRQVERSWGLSDDSVYHEIDIPNWRSEASAAALSAAVPGAGQAYVGQKRALIFALTEAAGWTSRWLYQRRGHDLADQAAAYAGAPADPASRWSFTRWEDATSGDASELRALYTRDRNVFYDRIAHDPSLLSGWAGNAEATRTPFTGLREVADDRLRFSRYSGTALWVNHIVSAVDALRAARLNNVALGSSTRLGLASSWRHGSPTLRATLRRSF